MTVEFRLPDVGEGVAEGEIVQWLVAPGDTVSEDQPVAEVETDKAVVEVPSPVNGTVGELRAEAGEVVPVGEVIITFEEADGEPDVDAESETEEETTEGSAEVTDASGNGAPAGHIFAPPRVRRLARELGVDLTAVEGSGPSGRITEEDVRAAGAADDGEDDAVSVEAAASETDSSTASSDGSQATVTEQSASTQQATAPPETADRERTLAVPATRKRARELGVDIDAVPASDERDGEAVVSAAAVEAFAEQREAVASEAETGGATETATAATATDSAETGGDTAEAATTTEESGPVDSVPYRGIRRTIGEAMATSKYTAPHVTHHDRLDATELVATREKLKPLAEERGVKLTYLPIVLKAIVAGLKEYPVLNSELREDEERILYKQAYNIGIATATDAGLMVPVVEDVDEKGLLALATEIRDLTEQARDRSIAREDMQGGTFTVTNFGAIGGEYATPIINYPETAILGMGALEQRPMVEGGSLSDPGDVVAKPVLPLSLAIDHRVIDGAAAAAFVNTVKEYLQDPTRLLLD